MTSISKDGKYVNLWDLLTDVPVSIKATDEHRELGSKVKDALNETSRWGGQEFCIHVDEGGWRIEVYSCHDSRSEPLLRLVIPKDVAEHVRLETRDAAVDVVVPERKVTIAP